MGTEVPEFPTIDPTKFYKVTQAQYSFPPAGCEGPKVGSISCCILGQTLIDYIAAETDCVFATGVCGDIGGEVSRYASHEGPFATLSLCLLAL